MAELSNAPAPSPEALVDIYRRMIRIERNDDAIRKTIMINDLSPAPETRDEFVRAAAEYAALGIDEVIVFPPTGSPAAWIDSIAPAVKALAEL